MNMVEVKGGPAKEREIVEQTVYWCIQEINAKSSHFRY